MKKKISIRFFALLVAIVTIFAMNSYQINAQAPAKIYSWGSYGETVRVIQDKLYRWGYFRGPVDGKYGLTTYEAVKYFQRSNRLKVDGIVGQGTLEAMGILQKPVATLKPATPTVKSVTPTPRPAATVPRTPTPTPKPIPTATRTAAVTVRPTTAVIPTAVLVQTPAAIQTSIPTLPPTSIPIQTPTLPPSPAAIETPAISTTPAPTEAATDGDIAAREADVWLLACVINGEGRGEPYLGQVAIGAVVMNRVEHGSFPKTISGVIYQPGAFDAVRDGQINLTPTQSCINAARDALNGWDPVEGAIFYWNPQTATSKWIQTLTVMKTIGNHVFAKN